MSSMRVSARLVMSHHGPPNPFKDGGAVADSLTGIHSASSLTTGAENTMVFWRLYK
jgi:hypothetical protein